MGYMRDIQIAGRITKGYWSVPGSGAGPGVMILHSWWGLNNFFKSVCDRFAMAGFVALAPDLYHGNTARTLEEAKILRSAMVFEETARQLKASANYLATHPTVTISEIGVVGFSMGGSWALWLADQNPMDVNTAVIYYTSEEGEFANAQAMVIGHFAENDPWVKAETKRDLEDRLTACGRPFSFYSYPGTKHWFCESNLPDAYNHDAAELAWQRTIEVLSRNLK